LESTKKLARASAPPSRCERKANLKSGLDLSGHLRRSEPKKEVGTRKRNTGAVTRAVEAVTTAAQDADNEAKKGQPESISNEWVPLWVPQQETTIPSR
jgi:hypothetical protein